MMGKLIQTLRRLRSGKRFVALCPRCRSEEIRQATSLNGWLTPPRYFCPKCGYMGTLIIEQER
ncbi:MAG: hypothetical protein QXE22_04165 [Candidatus Bathyarchaeia archaeon]